MPKEEVKITTKIGVKVTHYPDLTFEEIEQIAKEENENAKKRNTEDHT